jgi:glycogen(starch) synthase
MAADTMARVLMTADTVGGVWTHALELARGLGERGVRVDLATMGAAPSAAQRAEVARLPRVRLHESGYRLEWMAAPWHDVAAAGEWLLRLEATLKPDVVHLNQFAFGALPFRAPTLLVGHSCVLSWWRAVYGEDAPAEWDDYRRVVRDGLAGATLVAAPTRSMLASLQELHGHRSAGVVLPNGRSARDFVPARKDRLVLAAGRLWDAAKNIAALDAVAPRLPWPVLVAGPAFGPTAASTRREASSFSAGSRPAHWQPRWLGRRSSRRRLATSRSASRPSRLRWPAVRSSSATSPACAKCGVLLRSTSQRTIMRRSMRRSRS